MGEGGIHPLTDEFLLAARAACDRVGALLILDEVQTGIGRTGTFFAFEQTPIVPDAVTLAKGLAGGVPIGALLVRDDAAAFQVGDHGTTLGGNPLSCAAALATLRVLDDEDLMANARDRGEQLAAGLERPRSRRAGDRGPRSGPHDRPRDGRHRSPETSLPRRRDRHRAARQCHGRHDAAARAAAHHQRRRGRSVASSASTAALAEVGGSIMTTDDRPSARARRTAPRPATCSAPRTSRASAWPACSTAPSSCAAIAPRLRRTGRSPGARSRCCSRSRASARGSASRSPSTRSAATRSRSGPTRSGSAAARARPTWPATCRASSTRSSCARSRTTPWSRWRRRHRSRSSTP